jgi:hypothetical protein
MFRSIIKYRIHDGESRPVRQGMAQSDNKTNQLAGASPSEVRIGLGDLFDRADQGFDVQL